MVIYLSSVHLAGMVSLTYIPSMTWSTAVWVFIAYLFGGVGITGGAHRLWAHRSYSAHWIVRSILMLANSTASQGSIYHWARDHRLHHKFSETPSDPHNAQRGFFYAHMGWLLVKKDQLVIDAGRKIPMDDLEKDPIVMFQKKLDPFWNLFWCFVFPALVPILCWGEDATVSFFICSILRYICLLHATWTVNSLAHTYGYRPYDPTINPRQKIFW